MPLHVGSACRAVWVGPASTDGSGPKDRQVGPKSAAERSWLTPLRAAEPSPAAETNGIEKLSAMEIYDSGHKDDADAGSFRDADPARRDTVHALLECTAGSVTPTVQAPIGPSPHRSDQGNGPCPVEEPLSYSERLELMSEQEQRGLPYVHWSGLAMP